MQFAIDNGITASADKAGALLAQVKGLAADELKQEKASAEQQRTADKRNAGFVSGGTSTTPTSTSPRTGERMSIEESLEAAMQSLGYE